MNILGTGLSGLVGTRIVELLAPTYTFQNLSLETGVNITDRASVDAYIDKSDAPWVFHFAAKTDVDGAEGEKDLGEKSSTWVVNVEATQHIVDACARTGKKLLYVSTDFVFDGTADFYTEESVPSPQGWYAKTKYEGEKRVLALGAHALVIRIANPYRAHPPKADFMHKIMERLVKGEDVTAPDDQLFVPTFIDDIATAIHALVSGDASGIYHVVGSEALSPYKAAMLVAKTFDLSTNTISSVPFDSYFAGRAPRPFHAVLKNDKLSQLGVSMSSFAQGLSVVREQEISK